MASHRIAWYDDSDDSEAQKKPPEGGFCCWLVGS